MATEFNKMFLGRQLCEGVKVLQHFSDWLCPHVQVTQGWSQSLKRQSTFTPWCSSVPKNFLWSTFNLLAQRCEGKIVRVEATHAPIGIFCSCQ